MRKNLIIAIMISLVIWGTLLFTFYSASEKPAGIVFFIAVSLILIIFTTIILNALFDLQGMERDKEKEINKLYNELTQTHFIKGRYEKVEYIGNNNEGNLKVMQKLITGTNNMLVARLSSNNELIYVEVRFYCDHNYDKDYESEVVAVMDAKAFVKNFKFIEF